MDFNLHGELFFKRRNFETVSSRYLHSYDQGVHTCVVHDRGGCTGNASITVNVVGMFYTCVCACVCVHVCFRGRESCVTNLKHISNYFFPLFAAHFLLFSSLLSIFSTPSPSTSGGGIFVESPISEVLPNNSLIVASGFPTRVPYFRGVSGSNRLSVGQLIGSLGNDITHSSSDPFGITLENSYDPGSMYVRCFKALDQGEIGIYTYRTPGEVGNAVNFGINCSFV